MRALLAFSALYLVGGSAWFLRTANSEFVIYVLVIVVLLAGVLRAQRAVRWPLWMLWGFSAWGLMHVLGGAVEVGDHVLFAQRLVPLVDRGGDFYVLKYDQVVHGYLYGLVAVMTHHVLRHVFRVRGHDLVVAVSAVLIALGISSLNELMEFAISLTMENGVGGYDNTMLDFVFNLSGAVLAITAYALATRRRERPIVAG